jgi:hypothetical protein
MSQLSRGILAAIAVSLTCGAVQFASGRNLTRGPQDTVSAPEAAINININRAAKVDRAARVAASAVPTQTISLRLDALSDTSVLVRVPTAKEAGQEARNGPPAPPAAPAVTKPGDRKMTVACEPVVSVLTEVAKLLQPGRCVT